MACALRMRMFAEGSGAAVRQAGSSKSDVDAMSSQGLEENLRFSQNLQARASAQWRASVLPFCLRGRTRCHVTTALSERCDPLTPVTPTSLDPRQNGWPAELLRSPLRRRLSTT